MAVIKRAEKVTAGDNRGRGAGAGVPGAGARIGDVAWYREVRGAAPVPAEERRRLTGEALIEL